MNSIARVLAGLVAGALVGLILAGWHPATAEGQVSFMATNLPVSQAMGLPVGPPGLMLAMDALPDALATLGNVTANLAATGVVARRSAGDAA